MKITKGIEVHSDTDWVLNVKNNIHKQRQAGRLWNKFLVGKLTSSADGFRQSKIDECVFYQIESIYILYTDNYILEGPDEEELRQIVAKIKVVGLDITEEGYI